MTLMMAITATTSIVTKPMGNAIASTVPSATVCVGSCGTSIVSIINYIEYEMMSCLWVMTSCLERLYVPKSARHPSICILIQGGLLVQVRGRIRMDFAANPRILNSIGLSCVVLTRVVLTVYKDERYLKM